MKIKVSKHNDSIILTTDNVQKNPTFADFRKELAADISDGYIQIFYTETDLKPAGVFENGLEDFILLCSPRHGSALITSDDISYLYNTGSLELDFAHGFMNDVKKYYQVDLMTYRNFHDNQRSFKIKNKWK